MIDINEMPEQAILRMIDKITASGRKCERIAEDLNTSEHAFTKAEADHSYWKRMHECNKERDFEARKELFDARKALCDYCFSTRQGWKSISISEDIREAKMNRYDVSEVNGEIRVVPVSIA
jgi:hypothetical protein